MLDGICVNVGCGFTPGEGWENFDASPTVRIERIPLVGHALSARLSGNRERFPASVRYGDIVKGPLVKPGTANCVYCSHVLEHLCLKDCERALGNIYTMLAPGGTFRLIVPDLHARAQRYVADRDGGAAVSFMRATSLGRERRGRGLVGMLKENLGNANHLWMWDEAAMTVALRAFGFVAIRPCEIGDSGIAAFTAVEHLDRFVDERTGIREVALEARKRPC